ncbi:hypothetical protein [Curtobacterium sp. ZW137]|uniref:hypothetical protein n=1 Tax=Curtobacterium sp. ZW137 TaxID=2485104 RepID=UPI000F4CC816|nr:hypothetical protein [Curtobacterium sp. ZW137]
MTLHPQQLMIADVVNSGEETVVVEVPRRSSKTTSILATLLGRCLRRRRYKVTFSAQSGTKSAEFFREWIADLELHQGGTPQDQWPFTVRKQTGSMQLTFRNGSVFRMLNTPTAKALRGGAADVVWFDEAQEFDAELSAELKAGALPLMDTRDDAQLILSGTAGEFRAGWLWDTLEQGRNGDAGVAILEYAAPDGTTNEDINDEALWCRVHPGIGTLTTLEKMRSRRGAFADPEWSREYMGLWPVSADSAVIPSHVWEAAAVARLPYPQSVAFGFDVSPNGSSAAIVAAWRVDGVAYVELIAHEPGSTWVRDRIAALATKYKAPVGFDPIGTNKVVQEELQRARSAAKSRLRPVERGGVSPSCVTFLRDLEDGKLHHFGQEGLTAAAAFAAKRVWGDGTSWAWGRVASGGDITPLVAATMALRAYDQSASRPKLHAIVM